VSGFALAYFRFLYRSAGNCFGCRSSQESAGPNHSVPDNKLWNFDAARIFIRAISTQEAESRTAANAATGIGTAEITNPGQVSRGFC